MKYHGYIHLENFKLIPRYQMAVNKSSKNLDSTTSVQWLQSYSQMIWPAGKQISNVRFLFLGGKV